MKIKELSPNPKNPRKITDQKLKMLKSSYQKHGDLGGIVFNIRFNRLIGGHQTQKTLDPDTNIVIEKRYETPTKTGTVAEGHVELHGERIKYREVDVDELTEMAMNIAANKGAGDWDFPILTEWFHKLDAANFPLDDTMWGREELEKIMTFPSDTPAPGCDEDDVPSPPKGETICKPGDLWALGNHRLLCGDSTNIQHVEQLMNGEKADMVFTDPPYGINEETDRKFASITRLAEGNTFNKIIGDDSIDTAIAAFSICNTLSDIICYWGGNYYAQKLPASPCWIVWDKRVEENQRDMNSDCELAYVKHHSKKSVRIFRHLWKGMIKSSEHGQRRVHPTQKPIALSEWCLEELDPKGKTVLDLFGGSGSTLIACEKTNRKCFMMEIDPHYCDVIISRFEKFSGKRAMLSSPDTPDTISS